MNNTNICGILLILASLLSACATSHTKHIDTNNWGMATSEVVHQFQPSAERRLKPYFQYKHMKFPPRKVALLAFKDERSVELWARNLGPWKHIRNYPLAAVSGYPGPKLMLGDGQIPEGIYSIVLLNPFSHLHLSMKLNYPNEFDHTHAELDGRDNLGNDIYIHGNHLSAGCLAVGDVAIEELFVLVAEVGTRNTQVIIAPNDLRKHEPITKMAQQPQWVRELYSKIKSSLTPFHI